VNAGELLTPTVIFPDRILRSSFTGEGRNRHRFGGPVEVSIKPWPRSAPRPHCVMRVDLDDPTLGLCWEDTPVATKIPLIYGFRIDGCRLTYRVRRSNELEVMKLEGGRPKDWPYSDYPAVFPTVPLYFESAKPLDWNKLEDDEDWVGLTRQDARPAKGEMLVVVPPNDAYGVSLWGNSGDANQVQSIFRVNLKTLVVEAWNECT